MAYLELFDRVAGYVRRQGVDVEFERGQPVSREVMLQAKARSPVPIPSSLVELYAEVGDGFLFRWPPFDEDADEEEYEDDEDAPPSAIIELPPLLKVAHDAERESQGVARMRGWLPFHEEGNGDQFCLDTAFDPSPVVFSGLDAAGTNGHVLAPSLLHFFADWASVCFQCPTGLWWPGVFDRSTGGVNWSSREFRAPFRMPPQPIANPPMQRTGAAGIVSFIRKLLGRGSGR